MNDDHTPPAGAQALLSTPDQETVLDAHGFDPEAYEWYPVLRRPRADGWTPAKQRLFIETLADTASPKQAAEEVGMSLSSAYKLRRAPGGEGFAAAWDAAVQHAAKRLVDIALERAVDGQEEPVYDKDGYVVGHKRRYNDRLLMFLIRAHLPERYRHAHEDRRRPDEPPAPAPPPVAEAVAKLEPVRPAEPHKLVPPEEAIELMQIADAFEGALPREHDPRPRREPPPEPDPREAEINRKLDEVRRLNDPEWGPEQVARFVDDRPLNRRERRRAAARAGR